MEYQDDEKEPAIFVSPTDLTWSPAGLSCSRQFSATVPQAIGSRCVDVAGLRTSRSATGRTGIWASRTTTTEPFPAAVEAAARRVTQLSSMLRLHSLCSFVQQGGQKRVHMHMSKKQGEGLCKENRMQGPMNRRPLLKIGAVSTQVD
jgi:hypothetical protein